jgi:hypothetical protein
MLVAFCLTSCTPKTLYSFGNYDDTSYKYLKNSDEKSTERLIKTYQQIIEKQQGTRNAVPPGIYADYGFVLLQANRTKEGKDMLEKEIALYPESKVFIDRILKMFEK